MGDIEDPTFSTQTAQRSALRAGCTLHARKIPGTHFCYRLSQPQVIVRLEGLGQLKKSKDLIGTRHILLGTKFSKSLSLFSA
jgi:hypothetical protein